MKYSMYIMIVMAFVLQSCAKQYSVLTDDMIQEYGWTESELKQMQFYLSEDIVLQKIQSGGMTDIQDGRVNVTSGKKVEEIVIKRGTPGVLLFMPKSDRMAVAFEDGEERFLMFGPNPKERDRYVLLGAMWNERGGVITYNGEKYVTPVESSWVNLLVDLKSTYKEQRRSRVAHGRTVN